MGILRRKKIKTYKYYYICFNILIVAIIVTATAINGRKTEFMEMAETEIYRRCC